MITLADLGYDIFLNKPQTATPQLDLDTLDTLLGGVSGNKISSGISKSSNAKMQIDYNDGVISFLEGDVVRVEIRKFVDEKIGLRVYDSGGNTIVDNTA